MQIKKCTGTYISETDMIFYPFKYVFEHPKSIYYVIPLILLNFIMTALGVALTGDFLKGYGQDSPESIISSMALILSLIGVMLISVLAYLLISNYSSICLYIAATENYNNRSEQVKEIMIKALKRLPGYVLMVVLIGIAVSVPFFAMMFVIALLTAINPIFGLGILLMIPLAVAVAYYSLRIYPLTIIYATENLGIKETLRKAYSITEGKLTYLILMNLGFFAIFFLVSFVISAVHMALSSISPILKFAAEVIKIFLQSYLTITTAVFMALIYEDIKLRKNIAEKKEETPPEASAPLGETVKEADNLILGN